MRTVLALVALLSVVETGRANDEAIVKRLEAAGVGAVLDPSSVAVTLDAEHIDDALLELCELRRPLLIQTVDHPGITNAQLRQICNLPGLEMLVLDGCRVSSTQMKIVARAHKLKVLFLGCAALTDAGLVELAALPCLCALSMDGTAVTDAGLLHLEGLRGLNYLSPKDCPNVTDAGLRHLEGGKALRSLDLLGCPKVTDEGVARLQKAFAEVRDRDPPLTPPATPPLAQEPRRRRV